MLRILQPPMVLAAVTALVLTVVLLCASGSQPVRAQTPPPCRTEIRPCGVCGGINCQPDNQGPQMSTWVENVNPDEEHFNQQCTSPSPSTQCHTPTCQGGDNDPCYNASARVTGVTCDDGTPFAR